MILPSRTATAAGPMPSGVSTRWPRTIRSASIMIASPMARICPCARSPPRYSSRVRRASSPACFSRRASPFCADRGISAAEVVHHKGVQTRRAPLVLAARSVAAVTLALALAGCAVSSFSSAPLFSATAPQPGPSGGRRPGHLAEVHDPGQVTGTLTGSCRARDDGRLPDPRWRAAKQRPASPARVPRPASPARVPRPASPARVPRPASPARVPRSVFPGPRAAGGG